MLFLLLQANYFEKISLLGIFSFVNPNAPGLSSIKRRPCRGGRKVLTKVDRCGHREGGLSYSGRPQAVPLC